MLFPGAAMFEAAIAAGALLLDDRLLPSLALTVATISAPLLLPKSLVRHFLVAACLKWSWCRQAASFGSTAQDTGCASVRMLVDCATGHVQLQSQSQALGAAWAAHLSAGLSAAHDAHAALSEVWFPQPVLLLHSRAFCRLALTDLVAVGSRPLVTGRGVLALFCKQAAALPAGQLASLQRAMLWGG